MKSKSSKVKITAEDVKDMHSARERSGIVLDSWYAEIGKRVMDAANKRNIAVRDLIWSDLTDVRVVMEIV